MKTNRWNVLIVALLVAVSAGAQSNFVEDDIYVSSKKSTKQSTQTKQTSVSQPSKTIIVAADDPSTVTVRSQADRDVDEYNRRGPSNNNQTEPPNESTATSDDFSAKERIDRFHKKGVTIEVDDPENTNIYILDSNDYNVYVSNNRYVNPWAYGGAFFGGMMMSSWYWNSWYSPWYSPWYDPWYYSWHHRPYYNPWYWGGGGGLYRPVYHSPYRYYSNGRAPHNSTYSGYYGRSSVGSSSGRSTRDNASYGGYSSRSSSETTVTGRRTRESASTPNSNTRTNANATNDTRRTRTETPTTPTNSNFNNSRSSSFGSGSFGGGSTGGGGGSVGGSSGGGRGRR